MTFYHYVPGVLGTHFDSVVLTEVNHWEYYETLFKVIKVSFSLELILLFECPPFPWKQLIFNKYRFFNF